ncbi:peroxisomal leader peptide-processing protease-like [Clavelina lepadiformis]|uniref:peroxisomal leader peptide-processing protease-like n=1 Tax=Clavelina lepadiformis TaxID=159417 RepID=UPI004041F98F
MPKKEVGTVCNLVVESINSQKKYFWSGLVFGSDNDWFVISSFFPLAYILSCEELKEFGNKSYKSSFDVSVKCKAHVRMSNQDYVELPAVPLLAWKCIDFANVWNRVNIKQTYGILDSEKHFQHSCCVAHETEEFLPWFVLFQLRNANRSDAFVTRKIPGCKHKSQRLHNIDMQQGMAIWTSSCPFGDSAMTLFHGSLSKGILCNIIKDTVYIIDAHCLPGSEGGGVYSKKFHLIGIIVCSLVLKTQQMAGVSIACSAKTLWSSLRDVLATTSCRLHKSKVLYQLLSDCYHSTETDTSEVDSCTSSKPEVVSLHHRKGWGSGVVVGIDLTKGNSYILLVTCCHVVEPGANNILHAKFYCGSKNRMTLNAHVVYCSRKSWLDFAVLKIYCSTEIAENILSGIKTYVNKIGNMVYSVNYAVHYKKGQLVFARGHCLFETDAFQPTITHGVISSIGFSPKSFLPHISQVPILLHTTCIVHDGASGGALYSTSQNLFYGIIVNNVKETYADDKQILYPQVSFILPAQLFMPAVKGFLLNSNKTFSLLEDLASNVEISKNWLRNEISSKKTSHISKL